MLRAAIIGALACLCAPAGAAPVERVDRIVFIQMDDASDIDVVDRMPRLEALTESRGVRFKNSFVNLSLCGPARMTMLSGFTAQNHGGLCNGEPPGGWAAFKATGLVPKLLSNAGILTAVIGVKVINGFNGTPQELGFDHSEILVSHTGSDRYLRAEFDVNGVIEHDAEDYVPDAIRRRCQAFMRAHRTERYFLLCNLPGPHAPALFAARHSEGCGGALAPRSSAFNQADVSAEPAFVQARPRWTEQEIAARDQNFRDRCRANLASDELIETLADTDRSAWKIVTSDNGFTWDKRIAGKLTAWDQGSIRVPLIFLDTPRAGRVHGELVTNLDWPATILDVMRVATAHAMDGRSLKPFFEGPVGNWRTAIGVHGIEGALGDVETTELPTTSGCVVTERWHFCEFFGGASDGSRALGDWAADLHMPQNLADRPGQAARVDALRRLARDLARCRGESCWIDTPPLKRRR